MTMTVADLVNLFDLAGEGQDRFVGVSDPSRWRRVFGGQVLAQALVAALRTTEDRAPHSLHAYFLLGGDPKEPIVFNVERVRDGRSLRRAASSPASAARRSSRFDDLVPGQRARLRTRSPMPDAPPPEAAIDPRDALAALDDPARAGCRVFSTLSRRSSSVRSTPARFVRGGAGEPRQSLWIRIGGKLARGTGLPTGGACLPLRPDAARHRLDPARTDILSRRSSRSRASTTPCGSIARSARTIGCSMFRTVRARRRARPDAGRIALRARGRPGRVGRPGRPHAPVREQPGSLIRF